MKFTDKQQRCIDTRGSSLLVAAAAGSGKTAVLVERIVALVREGHSIDQMLIVTFTNAAAAEMRARIAQAFSAAADSGDERFVNQSALLERSSISTLHRFCTNTLRTHFQAAEIDPSFRISDQSETAVLSDAAMGDAVDACFESGDESFLSLSECMEETEIIDTAFSLYRFMMARPNPWEWLDEAIAMQKVDESNIASSPWVNLLLAHARVQLDSLFLLAQTNLSLCTMTGGPIGYEKTAISDINTLCALADAAGQGYDALATALRTNTFTRMSPKSKAEDESLALKFKATREEIKTIIKKQITPGFIFTLNDAASDIFAMIEPAKGLALLVRTFHALFMSQKHQRNLVDFNDLEHLMLGILQDESVCSALREKFMFVFVDEYQDSSAIQESILGKFARPDGLFFVGDVKQSIYRFRQADPSLFLSKYASYRDETDAFEQRIDLNQNFRSRANVLAAINSVFADCMHQDVTEIEYDDKARLYPGLTHPDEDPPCEVHILLNDFEVEPSETDEDEESLLSIEREALICAKRIHELVGTPIYDAKRGEMRKLRYRDVAILMRSVKGVAPKVSEILTGQGIPAYCDAGEGYFDMPEIRQILSILRVVDNGAQDDALLAVLRGPFMKLGDEDLSRIRRNHPNGSFSDALLMYTEKDDELSLSLRAFLEKLSLLRLCAQYQPLDTFISSLMNDTGIYAQAGSLPGGEARQANLRLLLTRAKQFSQMQNGSIGAFLDYTAKLKAGGDSNSAKLLGENEDVVHIMSSHKSKGLEFPVVFVLLLGRKFNRRSLSDPLLAHPQLGIGLDRIDPQLRTIRSTLSHAAIKQKMIGESLAEEVRILYVAMTRARDRLILCGSLPKEDALAKFDHSTHALSIMMAAKPLDLIMPPITRAYGGAFSTFADDIPVHVGDARFTVSVHGALEQKKGAVEGALPLLELLDQLETDGKHSDEITQMLSFTAPKTASAAALKTSVTALLREQLPDPTLEPFEPPQFMQEKTVTGASRGTLFHTAMREVDLARMKNATDKVGEANIQLADMLQRGIFTKEELLSVSGLSVGTFFMSSIGQRLLDSDNIKREWPFNYRMLTEQGETLLQGIIDCCFMENGAWILLDFKTDRDSNIENVLARHSEQLNLYAKALSEITDIPVRERSLYLVQRNHAYSI